MIMRPHVAASTLNLINHQVSESCFTGNSQRITETAGVCNNQYVSDNSTCRSTFGDINLHYEEILLFGINEFTFSPKKHQV